MSSVERLRMVSDLNKLVSRKITVALFDVHHRLEMGDWLVAEGLLPRTLEGEGGAIMAW